MEDSTVINGWHVYVHPCFESQLIALTNEVELLRAKYPESYQRKATTKLLAAVFKVINSEICAIDIRQSFARAIRWENKISIGYVQSF